MPANAIVYVMPTDESMVDRSPIIVFGEVLSAQLGPEGRFPTTDYLFAVEEVLKGFVVGSGIMVRQPGGVGVDGVAMKIGGLPMLAEGDRVLLFLRAETNGAHSIVEYALGVFWEVEIGGQSLLVREASLEGAAPLAGNAPTAVRSMRRLPRNAGRFRRWIADRTTGLKRPSDYFEADLPDTPMAIAQPYRLFRTGEDTCWPDLPIRWQEFDRGEPLGFVVDAGGQNGVPGGGLSQVRRGMQVWNDDSRSRTKLLVQRTDAAAPPAFEADGVHSIVFEDPFDEIEGSFDPEGGILAVGGFLYGTCSGRHTIPGGAKAAVQAGEGFVVTQDGLGLFLRSGAVSNAANYFERIIAHELGHAIGIAHPCEPEEAGCNGSHEHWGALMWPRMSSSDTSRARLHTDDRNAVRHLYPTETDSRAPDLVVESPRSTATSPVPRGGLRFAATVRNSGDGRSNATTLRYYRSSDSRITTADTELGADPIGALSASATDRQSIGQRAPTTAGTYYYGACVDPVAGESNTANNCSSGVRVVVGDGGGGTSGVDLVVEAPRSTESSVAPRGAFRFAATVRNQGDSTSSATTLRYYRSTDSTITTSDTQIGTDPIGVLSASGTDRQSIGQRAPSSDGTYYYGACVDPVAGESDTTNNCSNGVRIVVGDGGGGTSGADLVVEAPRSTESSVAPRGTFRFAATVRNQGEDRSGATTLRYYGSSDSRITMADTELGTDPIGALAASGTDRQSIGQRAPSSDGTYYYGACVDPVAGESDTTNNCSSGVRVVVGDGGGASRVDLIVESPRANETSVAPRGAFRIAATVRNQGEGRSNATTLRYYRSFDSRITTADTAIGTDPIGALSASGTDRQAIGQRAPTTPGTYYYGACVDAVAGETDTTNNCSSGVPISVGQGADDVVGTGFELAPTNSWPAGITYAQGRFYVVNGSDNDNRVYAYRGSDGNRDARADFDLDSENRYPEGITYAQGRFYVADYISNKVYAYRGSDGRREAHADFDLDFENGSPVGITYAEGRFYVVERGFVDRDKVYAYRGSDGRRDAAADFDLDSENWEPVGITYAEGRFYVVDYASEEVYAYRGSDGRRDTTADFDLDSENWYPEGITHAQGRFYVVDGAEDKVYTYSAHGGGNDGACRAGLVVNPGESCAYKGHTFRVDSSGTARIAFLQSGNRIYNKGTIDGVRWNFDARRNSGSNSWTIHVAD